jgi:hypothetical protein
MGSDRTMEYRFFGIYVTSMEEKKLAALLRVDKS